MKHEKDFGITSLAVRAGGALWRLVVFTTVASLLMSLSWAQSMKPAACTGPGYREFDFWVGDWDVFDINNPVSLVAHARVNRILDGCVLHENYEETDGHKGESFSIYDASRQVWHQTWVTNAGKLLMIEGGVRNGEMALSGVDYALDGKQKLVRGVWKPVPRGVRETAMTSYDSGKTWKPWFDLLFCPHGQ